MCTFEDMETFRVKCLSLLEIDTVTGIQILDKLVGISHSINTLGKGMNPTILPPVMDK